MTAARKSTAETEPSFAKDLAIDWLLRKAYPNASLAHAGAHIEQQDLAPEVKTELIAAVERLSL